MIIKNARLVTGTGIVKAEIRIGDDGRIAGVAGRLESNEEAIDANGMLVMPGVVDAHVHLRDPGATHKEDFFSGTCAALAGGVTTVGDMPNTKPATTTAAALKEKQEVARAKAVCDYALHFGATNENIQEVKKANAKTLKIYMGQSTGNMAISQEATEKHFQEFPSDRPILIHAEDQRIIEENEEKAGKKDVFSHDMIRSKQAAVSAVSSAIALAKKNNRKLHVCHLSSPEEAELVSNARREGLPITSEVTPNQLFLCTKNLEKLGNRGKVNPPLRSEADVAALWQKISEIDCFATDHAPHTLEEKEQEYEHAPSGMPGLETILALLIDAANKGRISAPQIMRMACLNPAKMLGLERKGEIAAGKDADIVIIDPNEKWVVRGDKLQTKCKWSQFEGTEIKGRVNKVLLRGRLVYENDNIAAKRGSGKPAL